MRVCLDTNVLISAVATRGLAADVFRVVLAEHDLVVPTDVLAEVERILTQKFRVPAEVWAGIRQLLEDQTVVPRPAGPPPVPVADAADGWILAAAIAGGADCLVTGDSDLLAVAKASPVPILTPREFWEQLRAT